KVCGECLSTLGIDTLRRLRMIDSLRDRRPVTLNHAQFIGRDGRTAEVDLPTSMWGISREALDIELLEQARAVGAAIHQPARCEAIRHSPLRVTVRDLTTNTMQMVEPSHLLIA